MEEKLNNTYLLVVSGILIITLLVISTNLLTPYLWFDEACQFWISKGLPIQSNPLAHENGLLEVIEINKCNLDPGGFGILLHFWSYASNHHVWLRLLPFIFFIGSVLSFIYLSYLWLKNIDVALLMAFIPILTRMVLNMGFELRPYSMECLGTITCVVALEKVRNKLTHKNLLFWSCILSFFMTSRYSILIVIFIASLYVFYLIINADISLKQKLLSFVIYSIPLAVTLFYIYFFALFYQNKNLEQISYVPYLSNNIKFLIIPIKNFIFVCLIGLLFVLFTLKNRYAMIKKYETLLFITVTVNILFIILSIMGKHPWDPSSTRCISLSLLVLLCFSAFLGELIEPLFKNAMILTYYFIVSVLISILYLNKDLIHVRPNYHNTYYNFLKNNVESYSIYVDRWESPCIKYLFEYGSLKTKKRTGYPQNFTFAKYHYPMFGGGLVSKSNAEFYKKQPKMNDLLKYDILITPELHNYGNNDMWQLMDGTTNFYIKSNDSHRHQPPA